MRLRFTAEMIDDDGERVSTPAEIETAVPNPGAHGDKRRFYEIFEQYEKATPEVRNQTAEEIRQDYPNAVTTLKRKRHEIEAENGRIFIENAAAIVNGGLGVWLRNYDLSAISTRSA